MRYVTCSAIVLALGLHTGRGLAQPSLAQIASLAGCYTLAQEPWSRPFVDSTLHKMPQTVSLDTATIENGGRRLRPNIPYLHGNRFPGTPRWQLTGDTVDIVWSDGFVPTTVKLVRVDDGTLRGHAVALSDAHYANEPPPPEAEVTLRRTACPVGFDEPTMSAAVPVPPGLDSAATAQWVAAQQRACRGRFVRVSDEVMTWNRQQDSLPHYRYAQVLRAVQCVRAR
jgi:hypothetical protein